MAKRETDNDAGTTGHEWDGIEELNKPLPKWWLYILYATIVWAIGYWLVYPAWPTVSGYTKGYFGYSQRKVVVEQLAKAQMAKAEFRERIVESDLAAIQADTELHNFALAGGAAAGCGAVRLTQSTRRSSTAFARTIRKPAIARCRRSASSAC
jgi:cytochrome c oxidase cbb3-type subunit 3